MMRKVSLSLLLSLAVSAVPVARADDEPQVALAADLGASGGGGTTPGGLRVGGRYLYRMADHDWFDGGVAFTFGAPQTGCGRTAPAGMSCDHGIADGFAGDLTLGLRRELRGQGAFTPFVRGGVFGRVLRFAADDISGAAAGVDIGAGVAAKIRRDVALVGSGGVFAGRAWLGGGVGGAGQLGMIITVGAELRMR